MSDLPRIVGIFLIDIRGHVLLQERDEHAPNAANQWGIVGGHVDPGEDWVSARDRELWEETGLRLPDDSFTLWFQGTVAHRELAATHDWRIWIAHVDLDDADITCGEGKQIVFVDPAAATTLDLGESLQYFLPRLLS